MTSITCPVTKVLCLLSPECDLRDQTGHTYCVEWIKLQRRIGYKLAGEEPPKDLDEGKL